MSPRHAAVVAFSDRVAFAALVVCLSITAAFVWSQL